jgi:hypothetical protein
VKPLAWAAIAGGVTAGFLLITRKASAAPLLSSTTPSPPTTYGETQMVSLSVPSGWRRATSAEVNALPELGAQANTLMNTSGFTSMQYGTLSPFVASDGNTYATWIEQHYHPPGGAARPWGLHHGVTVLAQAS